MKHAIAISAADANADPHTLADLARLAEDAGWNGVFLDDYIIFWDSGVTYDPWICLAHGHGHGTGPTGYGRDAAGTTPTVKGGA